MHQPAVLFVCVGNICRAPLAEAAVRAECQRVGLSAKVDSAGTGHWHIGAPPDRRAQTVAARHGIDISSYRGRQVEDADFNQFTHIIALDDFNLLDLRKLQPVDATAELSLLLDHVPGRAGEPVADPYYGDSSGFDTTWRDVTEGAQGLAAALLARG